MSTPGTREGRASSIKKHEIDASNVSGQHVTQSLYRYNNAKSLDFPLFGRNVRRFTKNLALAILLTRLAATVSTNSFWSMSAAVSMRLVPSHSVPRALAIFNGGNALATVVAAPLGSYLGSVIGWRGAFFCLVPVALIALVWQ